MSIVLGELEEPVKMERRSRCSPSMIKEILGRKFSFAAESR